jgi:hypothetical protein
MSYELNSDVANRDLPDRPQQAAGDDQAQNLAGAFEDLMDARVERTIARC